MQLRLSPKSCFPSDLRDIGEKRHRNGMNLWNGKTLLVPNPTVRQPLFGTSDEAKQIRVTTGSLERS